MNIVHVGTMGWSYGFWVGDFYPRGLRPSEFLAEYSKHFGTVEVNNTFYRVPSESTLLKWREQTPKDFLFSAKFPQVITHRKMLKDCEPETQFFIERISVLQEKVGPLLMQFPPLFGPKEAALLGNFLTRLPRKFRYAVEVRNKKLLGDKLYSLLKENGVALAINPLMPETEQITADFAYIRWEGDRRKVNGTLGKAEVDRTDDIKKWAAKISKFLVETEEVFGYFSKYYSGHPPTDARQLVESLGFGLDNSRVHTN
ncbi:MAG: DUF72 domain-containing protein [Candidatus Bathyarchaeia archaeon]